MAEKKKAEINPLDPCSVLAAVLNQDNKNYNDAMVVGQHDAAEAILERASMYTAAKRDYAEEMPAEYVLAAVKYLRQSANLTRAVGVPLRVRAAKILMKYSIMLDDPKPEAAK